MYIVQLSTKLSPDVRQKRNCWPSIRFHEAERSCNMNRAPPPGTWRAQGSMTSLIPSAALPPSFFFFHFPLRVSRPKRSSRHALEELETLDSSTYRNVARLVFLLVYTRVYTVSLLEIKKVLMRSYDGRRLVV